MPTGNTAPIYEGEEGFTPARYIARVARGFGAMIHLRDHPSGDALILPRNDDQYYRTQLAIKQQELAAAMDRSKDEWAQLRAEETEKVKAYNEKSRADWHRRRTDYLSYIEAVKAWVPPTDEHVKLKEFALSQLEESLQFDCGHEPYEQSLPADNLDTYIAKEVEKLAKAVSYNSEHLAKIASAQDGRRVWIQQLADSLGLPTVEQ